MDKKLRKTVIITLILLLFAQIAMGIIGHIRSINYIKMELEQVAIDIKQYFNTGTTKSFQELDERFEKDINNSKNYDEKEFILMSKSRVLLARVATEKFYVYIQGESIKRAIENNNKEAAAILTYEFCGSQSDCLKIMSQEEYNKITKNCFNSLDCVSSVIIDEITSLYLYDKNWEKNTCNEYIWLKDMMLRNSLWEVDIFNLIGLILLIIIFIIYIRKSKNIDKIGIFKKINNNEDKNKCGIFKKCLKYPVFLVNSSVISTSLIIVFSAAFIDVFQDEHGLLSWGIMYTYLFPLIYLSALIVLLLNPIIFFPYYSKDDVKVPQKEKPKNVFLKNTEKTISEKLTELKDMKEQGLITENDYEDKKNDLISKM